MRITGNGQVIFVAVKEGKQVHLKISRVSDLVIFDFGKGFQTVFRDNDDEQWKVCLNEISMRVDALKKDKWRVTHEIASIVGRVEDK